MNQGTWYSICWSPRDYSNPHSFIELDGCPRFYLSENGELVDKGKLENQYPHLRITEVFKTEVFVNDENDVPMPTHYRHGIFLPGQNTAYDVWLKKSFKINSHILEKVKAREELLKKNIFLAYASKIIRHDMHSGINTYIPRGLSTLQKKLSPELIKKHKLGLSIKLLENGLRHTQQVYKGVYAFTNLVRENLVLEKEEFSLHEALIDYISLTAYASQVEIEPLPTIIANKSLICTGIDNLIRNGLKYNDSKEKKVRVYQDDGIVVEDNGRGMSQEDFDILRIPYERNNKQKEEGSGLGLHICMAILEEHNYTIQVTKLLTGTKIKINLGE